MTSRPLPRMPFARRGVSGHVVTVRLALPSRPAACGVPCPGTSSCLFCATRQLHMSKGQQ